jgi:hypothetical protein
MFSLAKVLLHARTLACLAFVAAGAIASATFAAGTSCDSACMEDLLRRYVTALAARDASAAPVAPDVRFSEDGVFQPIGEASWLTAGPAWGPYWLPITDPESGQAALFTTLEEGGETNLMTLRIKVEGGRIVEAEQMMVRPSFLGLQPPIQKSPEPRLLAPVPVGERVSRERLIAIASSYFDGLDAALTSEVTPFTDDCQRRENGNYAASNPDPKASGLSRMDCKSQFDTGFQRAVTDIRDRRIEVADVERQLVFAFAFFDHAGNTRTRQDRFSRPFSYMISEVFKVRGGKIQQVEATLFQVPYRIRSDFDRLREAQGVKPNHGIPSRRPPGSNGEARTAPK